MQPQSAWHPPAQQPAVQPGTLSCQHCSCSLPKVTLTLMGVCGAQAQRGRRAPAQQVWASSGHAVSALPNAGEWLAQHGEVRTATPGPSRCAVVTWPCSLVPSRSLQPYQITGVHVPGGVLSVSAPLCHPASAMPHAEHFHEQIRAHRSAERPVVSRGALRV